MRPIEQYVAAMASIFYENIIKTISAENELLGLIKRVIMIITHKECIECREFISVKAKKCKHCMVYQNKWIRRVVFFSPFISVGIALIALLATLTPQLLDNFSDKSAKVTLEILDSKYGVLELYATNVGNKGAVLGDIEVGYEVASKGYCKYIDLQLEVSSRVVKSNDEIVIKSKPNLKLPERTSLKPLTSEEYTEYEQLKNTDDDLASWAKLQSYSARNEVTVCKLKFTSKSSATKIIPEELSYNCLQVET